MKERLTKATVDRLTVPEGKSEEFYWDTKIPGFGLRIKRSGTPGVFTKSYLIQYRTEGRTRRLTLGRHGVDLTPKEAEALAMQRLGEINQGADPSRDRKEANQAPTVRELCAEYLARHARPHKRPKSIKEDEALIERFVIPALGPHKARAITKHDLEKLTQSLKATPVQANRLAALLSTMFGLAMDWGMLRANPAQRLKRFHEEKRERWLNEDELSRLYAALAGYPDQNAANAIRLLLLTGARRGEALNSEWSQIDFDRGVWTKPSHHTKQKKTEHIPLSGHALSLLQSMWETREESPFLFPGKDLLKPRADLNRPWRAIRKEAELEDVRLHDLRHTFASHLASGGTPLAIIGKLVGHTQAQTTQRYAHLANDALRDASDRFGNKFETLAKQEPKADVVPIKKTR